MHKDTPAKHHVAISKHTTPAAKHATAKRTAVSKNPLKTNTPKQTHTSTPIQKPTPMQIQPYINTIRTGAICNDGSHSGATGRGACSHHHGVRYWTYK